MVQGSGLVIGQDYHGACRFGGQLPTANGSQLMANYDTVSRDVCVIGFSVIPQHSQHGDSLIAPQTTQPDFYGSKGPGTDCWRQGDGATVPVKAWTCLEWGFDGSAPAAVGMRFWLDGRPVDSLTVAGGRTDACVHQDGATYVLPSPDFGARLDVGWESYNADRAPRTLWVDDVALGTERVGCGAQ